MVKGGSLACVRVVIKRIEKGRVFERNYAVASSVDSGWVRFFVLFSWNMFLVINIIKCRILI